ncbi:hypothetical protein CEXT_395751 [Caerostris extrusa]|uniref:P-loop containing nucleoside triphosphate hydrolase protein n=1 Tax=Caerostris extrusa TaxID=172846 RepID=A0AAV4P6L1_CAEEX|nr:hypothetical protein CEXT_395751 [Caerostris extrusa]
MSQLAMLQDIVCRSYQPRLPVHIFVFGIPKVGKYSLINELSEHRVTLPPNAQRHQILFKEDRPAFHFQITLGIHRMVGYDGMMNNMCNIFPCTAIFVYGIDDPTSLTVLLDLWLPEVRGRQGGFDHTRLGTIFVGNKKDLRDQGRVPPGWVVMYGYVFERPLTLENCLRNARARGVDSVFEYSCAFPEQNVTASILHTSIFHALKGFGVPLSVLLTPV